MERKTTFFLMMAGFITAVIIILYVFSLRSRLQEVRANQENYEKQISSLSEVKESEAQQVNREFLKNFFTYENPNDRYKNIKHLMTQTGYKATHPSGTDLPQTKENVSSAISDIKQFQHKTSKTEIEFLNEFNVTTNYNGVGSTEKLVLKIELVYVEEKGWKIKDIYIM